MGKLPRLLVVAGAGSAEAIEALFARRGFEVRTAGSLDAVRTQIERWAPAGAVVDSQVERSVEVLKLLRAKRPQPRVVGVISPHDPPGSESLLDAAFVRPVDPAQMFVRMVELLAAKKGKPAGTKRLTGIVAAVDGNDLFKAVSDQLMEMVPIVNAGAILEAALKEMGVGTFVVKQADIAALLASGRLARALAPFGDAAAIEKVLAKIEGQLDSSRT